MYVTIRKNEISISIAEFYRSEWYDKEWPLSKEEDFEFKYGKLEIDAHKDGRKYLTGCLIDPREFIVDYLKTRYRKDFPLPDRIWSVSVESGRDIDLLCVDFLKSRSFGVDGMEKDLIIPQFCNKKGETKIQGFEVLDIFSLLKYLVRRFGYRGTRRIRKGEMVYDIATRRQWKLGGAEGSTGNDLGDEAAT
ncbi:MAG: hypothetical protein HZA19_05040 [Nitrospirae bacterium]|nr:hypothetical protein [Nitrospirota bacterium]